MKDSPLTLSPLTLNPLALCAEGTQRGPVVLRGPTTRRGSAPGSWGSRWAWLLLTPQGDSHVLLLQGWWGVGSASPIRSGRSTGHRGWTGAGVLQTAAAVTLSR